LDMWTVIQWKPLKVIYLEQISTKNIN
jgi:hypothetical protein